ncbi:MAG TPA: alcohol dehydrogenase catalytic domain-containing protein [Steroidobacteraceae bacterium]|nr:alcohol dehydrogenase catalytic domain-containing protein [Steroidobacteraceae bacterium]
MEEPTLPEPGSGEVRIKVLAAGTGFTDTMIRRGRYPDFKGPLPFTPGYDLVGVVDKRGAGVVAPREGEMVADLCVVGGYAQYAILAGMRAALTPSPPSHDFAPPVCPFLIAAPTARPWGTAGLPLAWPAQLNRRSPPAST